jgi:PP-loop superfamily ATP-utilizing enzyme
MGVAYSGGADSTALLCWPLWLCGQVESVRTSITDCRTPPMNSSVSVAELCDTLQIPPIRLG